jgi:hypothetical protein
VVAIKVDVSDVVRVMRNLKAAEDQMPFAMSLALNEATKKTREYLIRNTWSAAHGINVRNKSFIGAAIIIAKGAYATKRSLTTLITENPRLQGRGNLYAHAKGGVRQARRGNLAIPLSRIPRGPRGIPARFKPKNMKDAVRKGNLLYMRNSKGKLELVHVLKPRVRIPKRVPFYEDYQRVMGQELYKAVPAAVERAMRTRRR